MVPTPTQESPARPNPERVLVVESASIALLGDPDPGQSGEHSEGRSIHAAAFVMAGLASPA